MGVSKYQTYENSVSSHSLLVTLNKTFMYLIKIQIKAEKLIKTLFLT